MGSFLPQIFFQGQNLAKCKKRKCFSNQKTIFDCERKYMQNTTQKQCKNELDVKIDFDIAQVV